MKVCIAEKPSVAKEIANILGAKARKDGYFEGNGYQVTWTFGHLCTLKEPNDYHEQLKKWNLYHLPILPQKFGIKVINDAGVIKQFETISQLVNAAEEVINCGDAGQEGEVIQRWVLTKAKCKKPVKRLWISSLTEEAIRKGFDELKDAAEYDKLYAAGSSRAIGDWLLGINATRLYTLKFGTGKNVLSIGRVQTPTLALIVNRFKEIEEFVSKPYWEIKTLYRDVEFSATSGKYLEKEKATEIIEKIKEATFHITSFEKKEGKESAPKLFDLTSLQVDCNKKLSLSADQTLKLAQSLYEKKFITYPRVDTRYLPNDQYEVIPGVLRALKSYEHLAAPLLKEPIRKSKNVFNDKKITDHHAIIPTNVPVSGLSHIEHAVYDLIVRRFLANFYPDCKISKTTVLGQSEGVEFKASGKQILEPGWRTVYENDKPEDSGKEDEDQILPVFEAGENGPHEPDLVEKKTSPPKSYTEATLLRAMETAGKQVDNEEMRELMKENGIGRPSTRANIIETLFRRKYIKKERKSLAPTITGIQLIGSIQNELLKSAELTGQWELKLRQIEKGEFDVKQFMFEMKTMVHDLVKEVKYAKHNVIQIEEPESVKKKTTKKTPPKKVTSDDLTCPKCKAGSILKGKTAFGCSRYKEGCTFKVSFEFSNKKLTEKQIVTLLDKGKTPLLKGVEYNGEKREGHLEFNDHYELVFKAKEKQELICPKCKQGKMLKGGKAMGCSRYKDGCHFIIPFVYNDKTLTTSQLESLILKKKTGVIKDLKTDTLSGKLIINNEFKIELT